MNNYEVNGKKINCALVVLNYNDADTTLSYIESVRQMEVFSHIIVVDNHSDDDSYERLKNAESERISVIRTDRNGGYAYGNNFGCSYAVKNFSPEILFVSNPDVRFSEDTAVEMAKSLAAADICDRKIAVVAPVVNQGYNAWRLLGYWGVIGSVFLVIFNMQKKKVKRELLRSAVKDILKPVGVAEGSFFAVRTDAFERAGGFDERTFLYYEENILAKRLNDAGYLEAVHTGLRYDHFHSVSVSKHFGSKARAFLNFKVGMKLYLREYLKTGVVGMIFFEICFALGYLERILYDLLGGYKISRRVGKEV